jgi:uncharacterized protein (DUF2225 family)
MLLCFSLAISIFPTCAFAEEDDEFNRILKDINQAINNNIVDHENIDTNIEILNNRRNMSDIKYQKLEEGQNILDGRKNQFEKDAIINDFIVSH